MDIFDFTGPQKFSRVVFLLAIIAVLLLDLFVWRS